MNTIPTLSIITINRNNAQGLEKTIESVVTQTGFSQNKLEYIIIDGASTDDSVKVIQKFIQHPDYGSKITYWISEPDTGIYNAMNKGIKKARGEYLYMLNSGDWLEENTINIILPKVKNESPELLLFLLNLWENNIKIKTEIKFPETLQYSPINHQGMIYHQKFHSTYLYDITYKYASDYDFCLKAFYNKKIKINYLYQPVANFCLNGVGNSLESHKEIQTIKMKYKLTSKKIVLSSIVKQFIKLFIPCGVLILLQSIKGFYDKKNIQKNT